MVHKFKTGCQWSCLFVDIESVKPPFSWQTVYYFYRKWGEQEVFKKCLTPIWKSNKINWTPKN
jgi:hypothetical protein